MPHRAHDCPDCKHLQPDDDEEMTVWVHGRPLRPGDRIDVGPYTLIDYVFSKREPGDQEGTT